MAYMNQDRKAAIAKALKQIIPASWKYSLAVRHHSTIVLTIAAAPVDLLGQMKARSAELAQQRGHDDYLATATHADLNNYHWQDHCAFDDATAAIIEKTFTALNTGNHDRSDTMTDYFDVGWYVDLKIGRWNKPFIFTPSPQEAAKAARKEAAEVAVAVHQERAQAQREATIWNSDGTDGPVLICPPPAKPRVRYTGAWGAA